MALMLGGEPDVESIILPAEEAAADLLKQHWDRVEFLTGALIESRVWSGADLGAALGPNGAASCMR